MSTHITPPPRAEQAEPEAAEPADRASRFDERGIALQTVIIMVVLLAIAGAIAAVLLNRGGEASDQLASADFGLSASSFTNETGCQSAGHGWSATNGPCEPLAAFVDKGTSDAACEKFNPRWKKGDHPADGTDTTADDCVAKT